MKIYECEVCKGIKRLVVDEKDIDPHKWMDYGLASDIGCWCESHPELVPENVIYEINGVRNYNLDN